MKHPNHSDIKHIQVEYWSSDRYKTYMDADKARAVRTGDYYEYTSACDSLEAACDVADMLQHNAHKDDIRVRISARTDERTVYFLPECFLSEAVAALNELF